MRIHNILLVIHEHQDCTFDGTLKHMPDKKKKEFNFQKIVTNEPTIQEQ